MAKMMTAEDRLKICSGCEHFVSQTKSCGTLIIGKFVRHKGKLKHLCGCYMPEKVKYAFAFCKIGKWSKDFHD